jgi:hypothetical protein
MFETITDLLRQIHERIMKAKEAHPQGNVNPPFPSGGIISKAQREPLEPGEVVIPRRRIDELARNRAVVAYAMPSAPRTKFAPEEVERVRAILDRAKIVPMAGPGAVDVRYHPEDLHAAFALANRRMRVGVPSCRPCYAKAFIVLHAILKENA